jgi:hypothetical protein
MKRHALVTALLNLRGNPRSCVYTDHATVAMVTKTGAGMKSGRGD